MVIGVLKEPSFEPRVSFLPEAAAALTKAGHTILVEQSAGDRAFAGDEDYVAAGAQVLTRSRLAADSDLLLAIHTPDDELINTTRAVLIGIFAPLYNRERLMRWAEKKLTVFSLDMLPRTSRAQSMDVLSSQANIAGYKAVLVAAATYSRYFPMFITAAGSVPPAKVLILGAGVAGLQAIATARRLGAVVEVFDTRPAVKEEVASLGGKFIEVEGAADASGAGGYAVEQPDEFLRKQRDRIAESIARADIVITTAQIPGKKAPVLISSAMIASMRKGSVVVDLAAATGGNTAHTLNNETVVTGGVTIIGNSSLAASVSADASKLYGKNVMNFLSLITAKDATLALNFEDDIVKAACISHDGKYLNDRTT